MIGRIYFGDDKKPDIWLIKIKVEPVEKRDINEETGMDLPTSPLHNKIPLVPFKGNLWVRDSSRRGGFYSFLIITIKNQVSI